jgi:hypothetical protein
VPVLLLLTAAAIIVGGLVVAIGRGGEMKTFANDTSPVQAEVETAADIALLRPPWALWGYQMRATDEVLGRIAQTVTERDVEIAILRRQLEDLQLEAGQHTTAAPQTTAGQHEVSGWHPVAGQQTAAGQQAAADQETAAGQQEAADQQTAAGQQTMASGHTESGQQQAAGQQTRGTFEPMQQRRAAKDDGPSPQGRGSRGSR